MIAAKLEHGHKSARRGEVVIDIFVALKVTEGVAECDMCEGVHGEVLNDGGHVEGLVGGGEASDEGNEVRDSVVNVGFEVREFFAGVLVVLAVVSGSKDASYPMDHLHP